MKNPIHKLSLRTLKLLLRFMRRTHQLFTGAGVAFVSAALIVGVFMLIWWGIGAVKSAIELRLERALVERLLTLVSVETDKPDSTDAADGSYPANPLETPAIRQFVHSSTADLVSASFSDLFSGTAWLNMEKTTLYHDMNATAFFFPPQFEFLAASESDWARAQSELRRKNCIGSRCVEVNAATLTVNGSAVSLPSAVSAPLSVSVGAVGSTWVVGAVYEDSGEYRGELWYFDGENFTKVFKDKTPFISKYPGTFGIGGEENNWLAVYGAYEGMGYQFLRGEPPHSVSNLLGIRIMGSGFRPAIARIPVMSHQSSVIGYSWYMWSAEGSGIRFLKLWEGDEGRIVGIADLSGSLWSRAAEGATSLDVVSQGERILVKFGGDTNTYREFIDHGFLSGDYEIVSGDLNTRHAEVRRARISRVDLSYPASWSYESNVKFFLANQPGAWLPVQIGEWLTFPDPEGKNLFWKAEFSGEKRAPAQSPFFDFIQVEYFLRFL